VKTPFCVSKPDGNLPIYSETDFCSALVSGCGLWGYRQGMHVNGYKIEPGAHLTYANLAGADLWNAKLQRASLEGADLSGAKLKGATISDSRIHD